VKVKDAIEIGIECGCDEDVESCMEWILLHHDAFKDADLDEMVKDYKENYKCK
jgi:hypothetical protein